MVNPKPKTSEGGEEDDNRVESVEVSTMLPWYHGCDFSITLFCGNCGLLPPPLFLYFPRGTALKLLRRIR